MSSSSEFVDEIGKSNKSEGGGATTRDARKVSSISGALMRLERLGAFRHKGGSLKVAKQVDIQQL
jgi:hypothetical protein